MISIILFIIFVLVMYIFYNRMERFMSDWDYEIKFFNKEEGRKEISKGSFYGYVRGFNKNEISARSNFKTSDREGMLKAYDKNVMNFSEDEKQSITKAIRLLFSEKRGKVPLIRKWKFIKMNREMDWGYPYTIDDYIVLPSERISLKPEYLSRTLFHEQLHIIQRENPSIFLDFYKNAWNFEKIELPNDKVIRENMVHNPDTKYYYRYKIDDNLYIMPLPMVDKFHKLKERGVFMDKDNKILIKGEKPYILDLRNIVEYGKRFYNVQSLYDPNEIFATILTSMIFSKLRILKKDQKLLNNLFKKLNKYFI